jgi:hypothetical protein
VEELGIAPAVHAGQPRSRVRVVEPAAPRR